MYDFGISGTKRSVRNRGVRKERLDCSYLGIPEIVMEIMAYPKSWTGPCTLESGLWTLDSGFWSLDSGLTQPLPTSPKEKKKYSGPWNHPPPPEILTLRHLFKTYIIVYYLWLIRTVYNEIQRKTSRHGYHR